MERDREVAALESVVETGGAALLVGPFGAGKSALLAVARSLADAAGARVLEAQAADGERGFAYGVVRQLLEVPLRRAGGRIDDLPAAPEQAGEAVLAFLANVAEARPVCVLVDDLHCADAPSLAALSYVVERLDDSGIAVVCAVADSLERWIAAGAVELRLAPLTQDGVGQVLVSRLAAPVDGETVRVCSEATGGVPFLVDQVVTELRRAGRAPTVAAIAAVVERPPPAVQRIVGERLRTLDADALAVAHAVAVLGERANPALAAELSGVDDERAAAALERVRRAGLPADLTCALVRSAAYHDAPPSARSRLHARAAALLTRAGAPAATVATHILRAPQRSVPGAEAMLAAAVEDAQRRGELDAIARYLRRRVDEAGEVDAAALAMLGSAELRLGRVEAAAANLARALEVIEEPGDRFRAVAELGTALIYQGRAAEAMDILEPAVMAARQLAPEEAHVLVATQAVAGWGDNGVFRRLRQALPLMADEAGTPRTDGEHLRLGRIAAEHAMHGSALDACRVAARGSSARLGEGRHLVVFHLRELALVFADDPAVCDTLATVEAQARRLGSSVALEIVRALRVTARLRRGELDALEREARPPLGSLATVALAECRIERGELDAAADALEHARRAHYGWGVDLFRLLALGRLQARQGQLGEALATFEKCARIETSWDFTEPAQTAWRTEVALLHHAAGDAQTASRLALESVGRTRRYGSWRLQGMALVAAARVGCDGSPHARLQEAIELLDRSGAQLEAARARAEYGGLLRREGQPREARGPLREAAKLAADAGATELQRRVARELELTGAATRRRGGRGSDELTPAEQRTAELAAEGLKNREIAATLLLSERTVEMQLSRVYRKLGIRTRRELVRARP